MSTELSTQQAAHPTDLSLIREAGMPAIKRSHFETFMRVASPAAIALLAIATGNAHAGLNSITENVTDVQDVVVACGGLISVIGVCLCGYKIVFEGATFRDVSAKLLGCAIIGGASAIAASFS